jgi:hypothetical protein
MKRYLTSYSKNYIKVRDRKLNLETKIYTTDRELADIVQGAIKSTNYHLTNRKNSKVQVKSINELPLKLSEHKPNWGDILPENITWESKIIKQKEKELNNKLNNLLFRGD